MAAWSVTVDGVTYDGVGGSWSTRGRVVPSREWPRITAQFLAARRPLQTYKYREQMDLSGFLIELGEFRHAVIVLEELMARRCTAPVVSRLVKAYLKLGLHETALRVSSTSAAPPVVNMRAMSLCAAERYPEALRVVKRNHRYDRSGVSHAVEFIIRRALDAARLEWQQPA